MLTVVYLTFRLRPRFEWFAASYMRELAAVPEAAAEGVQVVVIDGRLWHDTARQDAFKEIAAGRFAFEHVPPKPSVWQGPHRLTQRDYFCAASARNTAFALARGRHTIFVDDLSVLLPGWLKAHLHAATNGYVLAGTTCKHKNIVVGDDGSVVSYTEFPPGRDSRLAHFPGGDGVHPCSGQWLYGGTFSIPTELALRLNGQDEIHDIIGGEDYDLGIRAGRTGTRISISRACGTFEDEDGHHTEAAMVRLDKPWPGSQGPFSSNYLLNRLTQESSRTTTIGNHFDLRELRNRVLRGEDFPIPGEPVRHWVDGQPLSEM